MRLILPLSAATLVLAFTVAAAAGPCGPGKRRHCASADTAAVDFSAVSDISKKIVADEPAPAPIKPAVDAKPAVPYNGPTLGLAPLPRAPTVSYKWSLE